MFFKNYIRKQYVVHMINLEIEKLCKKRQSLHNEDDISCAIYFDGGIKALSELSEHFK